MHLSLSVEDIISREHRWVTQSIVATLHQLDFGAHIKLVTDLDKPRITIEGKGRRSKMIATGMLSKLLCRGLIKLEKQFADMSFFYISDEGHSFMIDIKAQVDITNFEV